jgi:hypothetical protein
MSTDSSDGMNDRTTVSVPRHLHSRLDQAHAKSAPDYDRVPYWMTLEKALETLENEVLEDE